MGFAHEIGRYDLPLGSVIGIKRRQFNNWRKILLWLKLSQPGYDVLLNNGDRIHFTEEEKRQYDEAMAWHVVTRQVYGACVGLGLRTG